MFKGIGILVSHTHWDREWYLTFQEYRMRLLKVMDKLLRVLEEVPEFKSFTLDGQTAVLEDFLEVAPEKASLIRRYVSEGRLLIGPWFTQPDESLASPEALVRNLLIGHRMAAMYGSVMKVGYLPDTFGHVPQLPQILHGFDIDNFVFMRGMGDEAEELGIEFLWEAPDGSQVIAVHMPYGYCNLNLYHYDADIWRSPEGWLSAFLRVYDNPPKIDPEHVCDRISKLIEALLPRAKSGAVLLMNGCDHQPPQPEVLNALRIFKAKHPEFTIRHGTLADYIALVRRVKDKLKVYRGELRGAKYHFLLVGVLSSRIYLKQLNYRSQLLLEHYAEPLSLWAYLLGKRYPHALLLSAWKRVLRNHAHDSIYGSGTDPVHKENEVRFHQAIEIASNIAHDAAEFLLSYVKAPMEGSLRVLVYNPLNWLRTDAVTLLLPALEEDEEYRLVDETGTEHPVQQVRPASYWGDLSEFIFTARDVPSCGFKVFSLIKRKKTESEPQALRAGPHFIENEYFRVEADPQRGGALRIIDKRYGRILEDFNVFVDEADAGDEYNYSPPKGEDVPILSTDFEAEIETHVGLVGAIMKVNVVMKVPKGLEGQKRSSVLVDLPIVTEVRLYTGIPRIDIFTTVDNTAEDHRLRVRFPTGLVSDICHVDGHFYVLSRPVKPVSKGEDWVERPPTTHPQLFWVDVSDGKYGVMLANRGLPEYEAKEENGITLYLTLIRAVGWLSRGDLLTRKGHAGPGIPVPEAQCKRKLTFEYSIIPHEGDWLSSKAYKVAREFAIPLLYVTSTSTSSRQGELAPVNSLLSLEPDALILTAVKKAEDSDNIVLRFYNVSGRHERAKLSLGFDIEKAWLANLNETPIASIKTESKREIELDVAPYKIITLLLKPIKRT